MIIFVSMNQHIRKATALLLAFFIFAATVSWTVEKHYCLGHLIDVAFFQEAESCGMMVDTGQGPSSFNLEAPSCCSNEIISIKGLEDLTYSVKDLKLHLPFVFLFPVNGLVHFLEENVLFYGPFNYNPPPILVRDIQVLYQVYLI